MEEWEKKLPPIIREKLAKIGETTPEERKRIRDTEKLDLLLSSFYKGEVNSEKLWAELKKRKDQGKGFLLKEAQLGLIRSISSGSKKFELQRKKEGISDWKVSRKYGRD